MPDRNLADVLHVGNHRESCAGLQALDLARSRGTISMIRVTIDGVVQETTSGERLIDVINRAGVKISQVCYHPQLGPIETCDTCMVETNGQLVRACATTASAGMEIFTKSEKAAAAQREAFDRILSNHVLYCTVCDNNNGNCTIHNTERLLGIEHQSILFIRLGMIGNRLMPDAQQSFHSQHGKIAGHRASVDSLSFQAL